MDVSYFKTSNKNLDSGNILYFIKMPWFELLNIQYARDIKILNAPVLRRSVRKYYQL